MVTGLKKQSNFQYANEVKHKKREFNRAILYSYLLEGMKTLPEMCKLMNAVYFTVTEHCNRLEEQGFIVSEYGNLNSKQHKMYFVTEKRDYPWPESYLNSKDPRRDYLSQVYPNIHKELLDAIHEGKISVDVIRTFKEKDAAPGEWTMDYKPQKHGGFQSTMNGDYVI
jgi:hypothetical protein